MPCYAISKIPLPIVPLISSMTSLYRLSTVDSAHLSPVLHRPLHNLTLRRWWRSNIRLPAVFSRILYPSASTPYIKISPPSLELKKESITHPTRIRPTTRLTTKRIQTPRARELGAGTTAVVRHLTRLLELGLGAAHLLEGAGAGVGCEGGGDEDGEEGGELHGDGGGSECSWGTSVVVGSR